MKQRGGESGRASGGGRGLEERGRGRGRGGRGRTGQVETRKGGAKEGQRQREEKGNLFFVGKPRKKCRSMTIDLVLLMSLWHPCLPGQVASFVQLLQLLPLIFQQHALSMCMDM